MTRDEAVKTLREEFDRHFEDTVRDFSEGNGNPDSPYKVEVGQTPELLTALEHG
jgi:hypothetical protein